MKTLKKIVLYDDGFKVKDISVKTAIELLGEETVKDVFLNQRSGYCKVDWDFSVKFVWGKGAV